MRRLIAALFLLPSLACAQLVPGQVPGDLAGVGVGGALVDSQTSIPPAIYCNFIGMPNGASTSGNIQVGPLCSPITVSRATIETTGLFTDAAGSSYTTCAANVGCFRPNGLMVFQGATNYLLNSDSPTTQTTGSLAAGTYTIWVIGSGSATPSAGTATGCTGFAATSAGTPTSFTCTGAGTIVVTVSGSLTRFQLENSTYATSYIPTTGATVTRNNDVILMNITGYANAVTAAASYLPVGGPTLDTQTPLQLDIGSNNSRLDLDLGNTGGCVGPVYVTSGLGPQSIAATTATNCGWTTNVLGKMAVTVSPNYSSFNYNGNATPTTSSGPIVMFTPSRIQIGGGSNLNHQCNCIMEWFGVWWQVVSLTTLTQLTQ